MITAVDVHIVFFKSAQGRRARGSLAWMWMCKTAGRAVQGREAASRAADRLSLSSQLQGGDGCCRYVHAYASMLI